MYMNIEEIMSLIPHRSPFLLVDRIVHLDENKIVGIKNVTINEPFFVGHFPHRPIMPGVLTLESMAQVGGVLAFANNKAQGLDTNDYDCLFMSVENVNFRIPIVPGDTLRIEVSTTNTKGKVRKFSGVVMVEDKKVADANFTLAIKQKKK